ncbi:hypothetical protein AAGW05_11220 [Arthrobacter sp. LAPM80]|uniref:hypothetical protein n=1 Tax=Arthrobacter sp. LAPM80 TaxID=3141788 RepID=UPI00398B2997
MRVMEATRAAYGLCQLAFPNMIFRVALGHQPDRRVRAVVRILGARHLLQALVIGAAPASWALHLGSGVVDSLHSASMVGLAVADRRHRRAAALDAVVAGLFAGAEFGLGSRIRPRQPAALPPAGHSQGR